MSEYIYLGDFFTSLPSFAPHSQKTFPDPFYHFLQLFWGEWFLFSYFLVLSLDLTNDSQISSQVFKFIY